ncbi:RNA-directed DNA polymerase [Cupriavidus necator]|uniref:RNA-directed DNA polymerase n=2 Tax=Cupriavidus necator (strain ATCC 17699 / DSM 428 / KCTC 22496 / NCIMB 10442 / H16 / Stanier 337) TaxID=381666 RepID=A0AAE6DFY4_CUPNH|nr:RNA-directed DNA polymerase [Cupriavidus necator]QCB99947.1 RNA-directed DNA polymerase [Cupriavidus necator H16]QQB77237.1 RNA-directed DNA polymerase [Cupriavidus necator]WKA41797.1 RNA-directed DNA polymerase [Cupriavidus necator]
MTSSKYQFLAPTVALLSDKVVLAQAWKKTHTYIRKHNWFADTLELDTSAVDLEQTLEQWAQTLRTGQYLNQAARMVPAPKSGRWVIGTVPQRPEPGWYPVVDPGEAPVLRPLAHLPVREQTVASALMLCLADCIETLQGPTIGHADFAEAQRMGVYSYGNRLLCSWTELLPGTKHARFRWGNSDIYTRYFTDYQRFIDRPKYFAEQARDKGGTVLLVKLDLSAFYDNIDVGRLIESLRRHYAKFCETFPDYPKHDEDFLAVAREALTLRWDPQDSTYAPLLRDRALPRGLAQGLAASGFFANAYLIDFDKEIGRQLNTAIHFEGDEFTLVDYCRYVDDLRIVVSVDARLPHTHIPGVITQWVQRILDVTVNEHVEDDRNVLKLNARKTEHEEFAAVSAESGDVAAMRLLQQSLSGPFDLESLQQTSAGLNGLLALAELSREAETSAPSSSPLSLIERPKLQVKDDTLTRFAAFRLVKSLRLKMSFLGEEAAGVAHECEAVARRLAAAWVTNPALVQVLRYAFGIYPAADILLPVLEALRDKLDCPVAFERLVAQYVLAELFRSGATEIGWDSDAGPGPDVEHFRDALAATAHQLLNRRDSPWYLQQQASLFLTVTGRPLAPPEGTPELHRHAIVAGLVQGHPGPAQTLPAGDFVALSYVAYQITGSQANFKRGIQAWSKGRNQEALRLARELLRQTDSELYDYCFARPPRPRQRTPADITGAGDHTRPSGPPLRNSVWLPLQVVFCRAHNPLRQENALLKLALGLVRCMRKADTPEQLRPDFIQVRCADWDRLSHPHVHLEVSPSLRKSRETLNALYTTPEWCEGFAAWTYALGRVLRAAALGNVDFTSRRYVLAGEPSPYTGIRSTWQKRRFGMHHASGSITGHDASVTPWFSELLLQLLRWPGLEVESPLIPQAAAIESFDILETILYERLQGQNAIFGRSSMVPVYRFPVQFPLRRESRLRVVVVQGLLPQASHFTEFGKCLDGSDYRAWHRQHLGLLSVLINRHVRTLAHAKAEPGEEAEGRPFVDLIVFPELSVHVEDFDLLRALSDATGAIIYAGMVGELSPITRAPINVAKWIIPQRRETGRSFLVINQGKFHLTKDEREIGMESWRPYQAIIELRSGSRTYAISGAICYDATDIALAADLRDQSHMFVVAAMNKDIKTFDGMISALRFHMYQHVVLANSGEYGGSTTQAPYSKEHHRVVSHMHGGQQIGISVFEVETDDFGPGGKAFPSSGTGNGKTPPAGLRRVPWGTT